MAKVIVKGDYLHNIYEKNTDTGNYIIPISLEKYTDVFNDWDNAPFKKRDMNPDLANFLEDCSKDIPFKYGLDVVFSISNEKKDVSRERMLVSSFRMYYSSYFKNESNFLKGAYSKLVKYTSTAFIFLSTAFLTKKLYEENIFFSTLREGIEIGAWVFLWEAITFFFFKRGEVTDEIKRYKRLSECNIFLKYNGEF